MLEAIFDVPVSELEKTNSANPKAGAALLTVIPPRTGKRYE
jgi:hypothetical protein